MLAVRFPAWAAKYSFWHIESQRAQVSHDGLISGYIDKTCHGRHACLLLSLLDSVVLPVITHCNVLAVVQLDAQILSNVFIYL